MKFSNGKSDLKKAHPRNMTQTLMFVLNILFALWTRDGVGLLSDERLFRGRPEDTKQLHLAEFSAVHGGMEPPLPLHWFGGFS